MWTREQLKTNAKEILRKSYWWAFLVCLVFAIIAGLGSSSGRINTNSASLNGGRNQSSIIKIEDIMGENSKDLTPQQRQQLQQIVDSYLNPVSIGLGVTAAILSLVISLIKLAINIFLVNPVHVGYSKYFIEQHYDRVDFKNLFTGFMGGKYMARVKTMFFKTLYTFLWSLLFIIPGIIKGYSYYLIPYILADNPDISTDRAFEISMKTMDGEKWDFFVLQLSFIGWNLLGLLACCIGVYFVEPYVQTTYCEFYIAMREKAIAKGIATPEEFNLTTV